ncbi:MAG: hypothetical protein WCF98_10055 [Synechococcus sp. ELA057]
MFARLMPYPIPILIIAWRRPALVRQLLDAIRPIRPARLFVFCDGFRLHLPQEVEKIQACRRDLDQGIDWPCRVERFYSEVNLGCRNGVTQAVSWFFEQVEEGIIFEDDCIPHPHFFPYCQALLERYRDDQRIWSICGSNFQLGRKRGEASYYFSIHGDSCGWASWRRAWAHYPSAEKLWTAFSRGRRFADVFSNPLEQLYWRLTLDSMFGGRVNSAWDYQWFLAGWMNHALHIWPNVNLITNVGFDPDGTHTIRPTRFANLPAASMGDGELVHPDLVIPDRAADRFSFYHRRNAVRYLIKRLLQTPLAWCRSVWA